MNKYIEEANHLLKLTSWGELEWNDALISICDIFPHCGIHAIQHKPLEKKSLKISHHGLDDKIVKNYGDYYVKIDPWADYISSKNDGYIFNSQVDMPYKTFVNSEYYNDHFRFIDDRRDCIGVKYNIANENNVFIGIHHNATRIKKEKIDLAGFVFGIKKSFHYAAKTTLNTIDKSYSISSKILLDNFKSHASLIVKEDLSLIEVNNNMIKIISRAINLRLGDKLYAKNNFLGKVILNGIRKILLPNMPPEISLKVEISGLPYIVTFTRISYDFGRPILYVPSLVLVTAKALTGHTISINKNLLKSMYSLTNTEMCLCQELVNGNNLRDAADTIGISYEHARQRLKVILQKTSTSKQSQLMVLLTRLSL
ncbi:hypothetical protein Q0L23_29630 (plasmid) [Klebsiella michiganensis]|uniref:helix-turn-helix transcriptional regulator n=1 Tax=Klebsiella michiganensis TaxID=1134687 RepID=UPI00265A240C|nr:hypothetical protein [Klebsiella michiganensis]WKJ95774.1 hypothetical protein Q0L46_16540 [Klebsiella michiganensis]WKK00962.1 hypothetical protein Q0L46_29365 [Klebsiella michiganensis]WKK02880.1 hypothetical protein Q0L23_23760 [Klebsiella michiganensis]WKK06999.1 hypothetical protein Q0L23_29630 [Klebsiella michiganensis]